MFQDSCKSVFEILLKIWEKYIWNFSNFSIYEFIIFKFLFSKNLYLLFLRIILGWKLQMLLLYSVVRKKNNSNIKKYNIHRKRFISGSFIDLRFKEY